MNTLESQSKRGFTRSMLDFALKGAYGLSKSMSYHHDELCGAIHSIFNPEPVIGNEGEEWYETPPLERLGIEFKLDTSYWRPFEYGSLSPLMRQATTHNDELAAIAKAQQVPRELFMGTLRLFADSIIEYDEKRPRIGPYRFYPAILMSGWASFESFVRIYSELLVKTVPTLPAVVSEALLEKRATIDEQGKITSRRTPQPLLSRYAWLLKFGYGCNYDQGSRIWQLGRAAMTKRNELVHYEFSDMPALSTTQLWEFLESILLLLIGPSSLIKKSLMPSQYELYGVLSDLRPLIEEFEGKPFLKDWPLDLEAIIFPCAFDRVDEAQFPTMHSMVSETLKAKPTDT